MGNFFVISYKKNEGEYMGIREYFDWEKGVFLDSFM